MKIINKEEFDDARTSNEKLNIQRIKVQRENNDKSIGNCERNKKINYEKKNKDVIKVGLEIQLINTESLNKQSYLKNDKLNEIPKRNRKNSTIEDIIVFIIYIRIIIINPIIINNLSEKEISEFNKYKYLMKYNKNIH